jgi:serine/threonine protein kinase
MLGTTIAHYKITAKLGQGGMGEVYRATDTNLDREVAIKVLPKSVAQDKERLARFEREAKVLAQLNHPNIAGVYGLEQSSDTQALILELVEGDDLSVRLKRGPLPVEEALEVCKQIAEALEAAHEKGIIHRDLKPGNIKLTRDGKVRVLDFGLAKALSEESETSAISSVEDSPTITDAFTKPGTILGTAAYMSPEQARGKHVDKRTDIWAFGCVLFECLTGKKAFQGEDVTETLAGIIKGDPDWSAIPGGTPPTIQLLLRKCLAKDRRKRLHHIDDAIVDLANGGEDTSSFLRLADETLNSPQGKDGLQPTWVIGLGLPLLALTAALVWFLKPQPLVPMAEPVFTDILLPISLPLSVDNACNAFAISHEGDKIVYNLDDDGAGLRIHHLTKTNDTFISGAQASLEGYPFLSYDGSTVGLIMTDKLATVSVDGGIPSDIVTEGVHWDGFKGADWSKRNQIVFAQRALPLRLVSAGGGTVTKLTDLGDETGHWFPQFLPGGQHVLFTVSSGEETGHAELLDLTTGDRHKLGINQCNFARYIHSGHIMYSIGSEVFAIPFDLETMAVTGSSSIVLEGVYSNEWRSQFDVSDNGTLVYWRDKNSKEPRTLVWLDKKGGTERFTDKSGDWSDFSLSPDQMSVAIAVKGDIWILKKREGNNDVYLPLVAWEDSQEKTPVWSHDGKFIYFSSNRDDQHGIWKVRADITNEEPEFIVSSERDLRLTDATENTLYAMLLLADSYKSYSYDSAKLDLTADKSILETIFSSPDYDGHVKASPQGKYLAYMEYGPHVSSIFLVPTNGTPFKEQITDKGVISLWSPEGNVIYFSSWKMDIYAASLISQDDRVVPQKPELITRIPQGFIREFNSWDVSKDDKRFLMLSNVQYRESEQGDEEALPEPTQLKIVTNWFTELNRLVPKDVR